MNTEAIPTSTSPTGAILDAIDALHRADQLLDYVISNRDGENPGEGWTIGAAQDSVITALKLLDQREKPQTNLEVRV